MQYNAMTKRFLRGICSIDKPDMAPAWFERGRESQQRRSAASQVASYCWAHTTACNIGVENRFNFDNNNALPLYSSTIPAAEGGGGRRKQMLFFFESGC